MVVRLEASPTLVIGILDKQALKGAAVNACKEAKRLAGDSAIIGKLINAGFN